MDANLIMLVAGVGFACFVLGLLVGRRRRDERMLMQPSPLAPAVGQQQQWQPAQQSQQEQPRVGGSYGGANLGIDVELGRHLEQLLSAGNKIEAIRVVRERTGMGLKESKDAVERLEGLMKRLGG
jgi:ribosomal protein L7/L12